MNKKVLQDKKTVVGLLLSILFSLVALIFAINDQEYWVMFVGMAMAATFYAGRRADQLSREGS